MGVLRLETYLTENYLPEDPVGRESKVQRIADAVRPFVRRRGPENLLVYGPAGVGKTTCVRHVFDRLDEETSVKTGYINCWQYNTRPSLRTELLIELGYPAPRKGKPVDELLAKLREWLDKNRGVAVALDEFDQLDDSTGVIYDLQLVNSEAENQVGITMVSNRDPRQVQLDPRSRSRSNCQTPQRAAAPRNPGGTSGASLPARYSSRRSQRSHRRECRRGERRLSTGPRTPTTSRTES